MDRIILATDAILQAIIVEAPCRVDTLIEGAQKGDIQLDLLHTALCWALYCVQNDDIINAQRLARLLQYANLIPDTTDYLGPADRESWSPSEAEIENWRKCALEDK